MNRLEVIASFDWLKEEETIGVLGYDKLPDHDVYSFEYSRQRTYSPSLANNSLSREKASSAVFLIVCPTIGDVFS